MAKRLTIPGFVNAHSHAFQRALRGRTEGGDFWAWRDTMLALADQQDSERVRTAYEQVYREMRAAGYTAVGEFHYLGFVQALAAAEAADAANITFVLLYAAYARGGVERFRQPSVAEYLNQVERLRERGIQVGLAPHSVRACPPDWLEEIGRYAAEHDCRSTSTPTSNRGRSTSASRSTASARSSSWPARAASGRGRP